MKWKDFAIGKKMAVGFGVVLFLLAASTVASFIGVGGIVGNAGQVIAGNRLDGFLAQKEVDHLNWSSKVNGLITDDRINELDVELDDHKCSLGSWLYSDERKKAEQLVPDLIPLLKKIEVPHERLHKSAISIKDNYRAADPDLPEFMTARESDHLKWAEAVYELFLHNLPQLIVETDASNCPLGKWLEGPGAQKAVEADPDLYPIIESLKAPHRKIHQSALDIQKAWKQIHPGLLTLLQNRLDDHRRWTEALAKSVIQGRFADFLETDPEKCAFGQFLNEQSTRDMAAGFPELQAALEAVRVPHERLHKSAVDINKALEQGDRLRAEQIFISSSMPALEEVSRSLHDALSAETRLVKSQHEAEKIFFTVTKPAMDEVMEGIEKIRRQAEKALAGEKEARRIYIEETLPALNTTRETLNEIRSTAKANIMTDEAMLSAANQTNIVVPLIGFLAFVFGVLLAVFITRSITRPIDRVVKFTSNLSEGDFPEKLDIDQKDEIGFLADTMNLMVGNLKGTVQVAELVAHGDLSARVTLLSERDILGRALVGMIDNLNSLVQVAQEIAGGDLTVKVNLLSDKDVLGNPCPK